ncbi:MAG: iron-only hydrogenase system regulator [Eubacteriales bacterium]|nr:iron-only hydrogenase system regulator [Eubacteriales bacterium]
MNRIGVIGIVIEDMSCVRQINEILHEHSHIIIGRMGIPYKTRNISVISIIVDGTNDLIGSLSGKLGAINGVTVKSALTKKTFED